MQTAFLIAAALLLLGLVLRAHIKLLQILYLPAAIIGGLIGLGALALLTPQVTELDLSAKTILDSEVVPTSLVGNLIKAGDSRPEDVKCTVREVGKRWHLSTDGKHYAIVDARDRLRVYQVPTWLNTKAVIDELKTWPGWLIAVVFATLFLDKPGRSFRKSVRGVARQSIVVWIISIGQVLLGLLAVLLIIKPLKLAPFNGDVPIYFGQLIEAGFVGGHGTSAALGKVYEAMNFPEAVDLAFFMATVGLVYSVVSGMFFVNLAVRCGWTRAGNVKIPILRGLEPRQNPQPMAWSKVSSEVLDPLVFQTIIVAAAFAIGLGLKTIIGAGIDASSLDPKFAKYVDLPLFLFTLLGGMIVRDLMRLMGIADLIDPESIKRLCAFAMELLIISAIASLNLHVVKQSIVPLSILLIVAFAWTALCLLFIGRKLLPRGYWFELGIINYGMSTGTTATGLMLLRIVDKDLDSGAAEDYALAAPLSSPFVGGGLVTVIVFPLLLLNMDIAWLSLSLVGVMGLLFAAGYVLANDKGSSPSNGVGSGR